jgi:hypothetical protein
MAGRQSETQAGRRSENVACVQLSDKRDLMLPASGGGNAPSACPQLHSTDRPITRIARNTIVPIPSSQTAFSAGPLWSEQRKGLTRIEAPPLDLGGVLPMTPDLVCSPDRMLRGFYVPGCPPQSHLSFHRHPSPLEHLLSDKTRFKVITLSQPTSITSRLVDYLFCLFTTTIPTLWYY